MPWQTRSILAWRADGGACALPAADRGAAATLPDAEAGEAPPQLALPALSCAICPRASRSCCVTGLSAEMGAKGEPSPYDEPAATDVIGVATEAAGVAVVVVG